MEKNLKIPSEILEQMILSYSLHNAAFFLKVKNYLTTDSYKKKSYFNDNKNQLLFNILSRWYDKYNSFPVIKEMKVFIDRVDEDDEIKFLLSTMVDKYYAEDTSTFNEKNLVDETQQFITENRVIEAIASSQEDMAKGTYGNIVDKIRDAVTVSFDKDLGTSIKDFQEAKIKLDSIQPTASIQYGLPTLDYLTGGLFPQEITVFASTPGLGKTLTMGNIALNAFGQGKKVAVYSMETGTARLLTRYYANIFNETKRSIIADTDSIAEKIKTELAGKSGDVVIKEYGANQISSNDIMAHLNDLKMYKGWVPDLVVIDYILIMLTNDKKGSADNGFKYYKTVTEEIRNIGKFFNVPIVSACQINREGMDEKGGSKALTTAKDIAESRGIYDTADYFLTINQPARDKDKGIITYFLDKNRNEQNGRKIRCAVDYDHMRVLEAKEE